jgi:hypothetical protein
LSGAVAAMLAFVLGRRVSGSNFGGSAGAASLAVCHLHWSTSAVAEVYSLTAAMLLLLLIAARRALEGSRGGAAAFGLLAGISLLHHRMLLVAGGAIALVLLVRWAGTRDGRRDLLAAVAGLVAGSLPFWLLVIADDSARAPLDFLLGSFRPRAPGPGPATPGVAALLLYEARFLVYNLAGPQLLLAFLAFRRSWGGFGPMLILVALTSLLCPFLFPHVGDRYVLLLPAIVAASVGVASGATALVRRPRMAAVALLLVAAVPPALYATVSRTRVADRIGLFKGADPRHARSFLWPGKSGTGRTRELAIEILNALPPGSTLLSHWGEGRVLHYLKEVEGMRPDVTLSLLFGPTTAESATAALARGRTFLSTYPFLPLPPSARKAFRLTPVIDGMLWEIRRD